MLTRIRRSRSRPIDYLRVSDKTGSSRAFMDHNRSSASSPGDVPATGSASCPTTSTNALWAAGLAHDFPISRPRTLSSPGKGA